MTIDEDTFRAVLGRFATGVTVVTTVDKTGRDYGVTVTAFCSVSLDPPLILVSISTAASVFAAMRASTNIVINILAADQEALSRRFAEPQSDRFDGVGYSRSPAGCVVLDDVLAWIECRVTERHEAGDHVIMIAKVEHAHAAQHRPLLHYRGGYAQLER